MIFRLSLLVLLLLAGCGRPLTLAERGLAQGIFGETLDPGPVRFSAQPWVGATSRLYPVRPRSTCRERIAAPRAERHFRARAGAVALWQQVNFRRDVFWPDYAATREGMPVLAARMFALHELTHVWQWQNRALTGYSPFRAAREHLSDADPYLFEAGAQRFLDYGYEQQAAMVEEYYCCAALDPQGARSGRLHALLSQVLPLPPLPLQSRAMILPWAEAETRGICS